MHQFNWSPGIGDPTIGGWATVVLYFLAVWSTWKTTRSVSFSSEGRLWRAISILFIALGINKQLDLQTALTKLGRMVASEQGWYGERQTVQVWFIIGVALTCIFIAIILLIWARKSPAPTWLALIGMTTVLAFVLIRAASFHHIDKFIGNRILGLKWNWVLEMTGIATVIIASEWRRLTQHPPDFPPNPPCRQTATNNNSPTFLLNLVRKRRQQRRVIRVRHACRLCYCHKKVVQRARRDHSNDRPSHRVDMIDPVAGNRPPDMMTRRSCPWLNCGV